jgi:hypothetical protein
MSPTGTRGPGRTGGEAWRAIRRGLVGGAGAAVPLASGTAFAAAVVITLLSDVPHPLPGIALGSDSLFYIERGVAAFAALVIAMSLLGRGLKGELPSQVSTSGLTYPERLERAVTTSDVAIAALSSRVDKLDEDLSKRDEVIRLLASEVLDLSAEIGKEKGAGGSAAGD